MRQQILATVIAILCSATLAWAGSAPSNSSDYPSIPTRADKVAFVWGPLGPGAYRLFLNVLDSAAPDIVALNSPGGRIDQALYMARGIQHRGLNTFIYGNRFCSSACALMFLAGQTKYAKRGAAIGLHSAATMDGALNPRGTAAMAEFLASVPNMPASVIEAMERTPPEQMYWLTAAEMAALGIVTLKPGQKPKEQDRISDASDDPITIEIEGIGKVEVGREFLSLSPVDQQRTVDEIGSSVRNEQAQSAKP
jgi:hypothetical protein